MKNEVIECISALYVPLSEPAGKRSWHILSMISSSNMDQSMFPVFSSEKGVADAERNMRASFKNIGIELPERLPELYRENLPKRQSHSLLLGDVASTAHQEESVRTYHRVFYLLNPVVGEIPERLPEKIMRIEPVEMPNEGWLFYRLLPLNDFRQKLFPEHEGLLRVSALQMADRRADFAEDNTPLVREMSEITQDMLK